jgi:hypothetical protein
MEVLLMREERIQGAACLAAVAILGEVKAPEGWRKVPMWVDIAESYVEATFFLRPFWGIIESTDGSEAPSLPSFLIIQFSLVSRQTNFRRCSRQLKSVSSHLGQEH